MILKHGTYRSRRLALRDLFFSAKAGKRQASRRRNVPPWRRSFSASPAISRHTAAERLISRKRTEKGHGDRRRSEFYRKREVFHRDSPFPAGKIKKQAASRVGSSRFAAFDGLRQNATDQTISFLTGGKGASASSSERPFSSAISPWGRRYLLAICHRVSPSEG